MNSNITSDSIKVIPVDKIVVLNPRERGRKKFQEVVESINSIGLKRPISVTLRAEENGDVSYLLICGQGRLEAFKKLGENQIPAIIKNRTEEDCYLMSLVENLARRHHSPIEILRDIGTLSNHGYSSIKIAEKTGISKDYVRDILKLLDKGEERLINAVERNQMPITVAMAIANSNDEQAQQALSDAYERGLIKGKQLSSVSQFIAKRKAYGKQQKSHYWGNKKINGSDVAKVYEEESKKLNLLIQRADAAEYRLDHVSSSLKSLFENENFINLMRAEKLETIPKSLIT